MAADYKRGHITWGRILAPYVCLSVWHIFNVVTVATPTVGSANHCNTRDMFPPQANALNSLTMQARQTYRCAAANQSNLPFKGDAAAGIPANITQLTSEVRVHILDWIQSKQKSWDETFRNVAENVFARFPWLSILVLTIVLLVDEIQLLVMHKILHEWLQEKKPAKHKIGTRTWPTKWWHRFAQLCMILFAIACVVQYRHVDFQHMPFLSNWPRQSRDKLSKIRQKPDMFQYISGCHAYLWAPSQPIKLQQKCTLGDGNCWWRAIAHGLPQKWYTIKRKILKHAAQNMTLDDCQKASVKVMLKPNAWADEVAAHATAHYLQRTVVVVSGQQIIMIKPDSVRSKDTCPIIVGHDRNHFSFVHTQQAQQILKQHMHKSPRTFADYRASVLDDDSCSCVTRSTVRSIKLRWNYAKARVNKAANQTVQQLVYPTRHVPGDTLCKFAHKSQLVSRQHVSWNDEDDAVGVDQPTPPNAALYPFLNFNAKNLLQYGIVFGYLGMIGICHLIGGSDSNLHSALWSSSPDLEPSGSMPDVLIGHAPSVKENWWNKVEILKRGVLSSCLAHTWCKLSNAFLGLSIRLSLYLLICSQGFCLDKLFSCYGNCRSYTQATQQISANLLCVEAACIPCALGHFSLAYPASCQLNSAEPKSPSTLEVGKPKPNPSQPRSASTLPEHEAHTAYCKATWDVRNDEDHESRHSACPRPPWKSLRRFANSPYFWGGAFPCCYFIGYSGLAYAGIHAIAANHQAFQMCMQDVETANRSFGPSSNQVTTCPSIGSFWDFQFRQFAEVQQGWKGTLACSCDLQIFEHEQHAALCDYQCRLNETVFHKFRPFHLNDFKYHPQFGDQMALAEQIRRVAQGENQSLPRAWRGRTRPAGNLVPRILERPSAKARVSQPTPSRSPDLDLARAVMDEPIEAPDSPEPVEIVELLENDPGTQEQQVQLISIGVRWEDNQAVQVLGHLVVCDLQNIEDPGRDRSLQGHLGYHPDTVSRLIANMEFMQPFFDALYEALQHRQSTIRFTCTSGRHRSVVAVHLAKDVLRGIVSYNNISIQHASRGHWGRLCNIQCAECYNFVNHPPAPYLRAVADIREDLLQALRGYMHRCRPCMLLAQGNCHAGMHDCPPCLARITCAGTISNPCTSPSTCAVGKIKRVKNVTKTNSTLLQHIAQQFQHNSSTLT